MQNAPNPIDPAEMGLEGSPVTGKQAASRPVCKAILVQHCPAYGFYDGKPKPTPAVQMLSPTNPYSLVFDLPYEENALLSSVGGAVEKAIRRHGELPTADLKKFWELQCLLNKLSTTPLGTSVNHDKVTTLVDEEGNKLYVINMPENQLLGRHVVLCSLERLLVNLKERVGDEAALYIHNYIAGAARARSRFRGPLGTSSIRMPSWPCTPGERAR